jgi:hypothetical protein
MSLSNKSQEHFLDQYPRISDKSDMAGRISPLPMFDVSLAFLASAITVLCFGLAVYTMSTSGLGSFDLADDEVKVEAARFSTGPESDMDIFASNCEGKDCK